MKKKAITLLDLEKEILKSEKKTGEEEGKNHKNMDDYFKITIIKKSLIIV